MIKFPVFFLALSFFCLFNQPLFAEAPVVDDSQNFAVLDDQDVSERPLAKDNFDSSNGNESALAHDSVDSSTMNNATLLEKVQSLQQEVQELRGQLEVQTHDLKVLQEQQLSLYKDLDSRINTSPATPITKKPTVSTNDIVLQGSSAPQETKPVLNETKPLASAHGNPADEQISYMAAYESIKNKQYDNALTAMQAFVDHYPKSTYVANAQYWLGELYMLKKAYPEAIDHFDLVVQQFPNSSKTAASLLKIGYALAALGNTEEAKQRLKEVIKNYPDTNTAQLAATKLESLDS